jgi:ATP-binding cassette, subfamily C (CFTR/MRP), member 1
VNVPHGRLTKEWIACIRDASSHNHAGMKRYKLKMHLLERVNGTHILKDISTRFPRPSFTIIVRPVESGKSTILRSLLGEASCSRGVIRVCTPDVAFCDQTPWLINASVRNNIFPGSDLDRLWYETVLQTCALKKDLEKFLDGDSTWVGSGGMILSGG